MLATQFLRTRLPTSWHSLSTSYSTWVILLIPWVHFEPFGLCLRQSQRRNIWRIAPQQEINLLSGPKLKTRDELGNDVISMRVQFGVFEVNLRERELRKFGVRVNLQQKPFQILRRLLETPGEFVSREDLANVL